MVLEHSQQNAKGKEIFNLAQAMIEGASEDICAEVARRREAGDPKVDDVERELNQKRADLEASGAELPAAFIREYEARKALVRSSLLSPPSDLWELIPSRASTRRSKLPKRKSNPRTTILTRQNRRSRKSRLEPSSAQPFCLANQCSFLGSMVA